MTTPTGPSRDPDPVVENRLAEIIYYHRKAVDEHGGTEGFCRECGEVYPCLTRHIAAGWGSDAWFSCDEAGYCEHDDEVMR